MTDILIDDKGHGTSVPEIVKSAFGRTANRNVDCVHLNVPLDPIVYARFKAICAMNNTTTKKMLPILINECALSRGIVIPTVVSD